MFNMFDLKWHLIRYIFSVRQKEHERASVPDCIFIMNMFERE